MRSEQCPGTRLDDIAYWRLTRVESARYHARLARMYADRARVCSAEAAKAWRNAQWANAVVVLALIVAVASVLLGMVLR